MNFPNKSQQQQPLQIVESSSNFSSETIDNTLGREEQFQVAPRRSLRIASAALTKVIQIPPISQNLEPDSSSSSSSSDTELDNQSNTDFSSEPDLSSAEDCEKQFYQKKKKKRSFASRTPLCSIIILRLNCIVADCE